MCFLLRKKQLYGDTENSFKYTHKKCFFLHAINELYTSMKHSVFFCVQLIIWTLMNHWGGDEGRGKPISEYKINLFFFACYTDLQHV